MVYCQQCGADNASDARFCNQCGATIARVGEPGGPLEPAVEPTAHDATNHDAAKHDATKHDSIDAPARSYAPQSLDVSTVSLAAIGVRSRGKAWTVITLAVLVLLGIGAGGMWLAMRPDGSDPVASADETDTPEEGTEEVVLGDLIPQGEEAPDVLTGTPRPAEDGRPSRGGESTAGERRPSEERGGDEPSGSSDRGSNTGGSNTGGSDTGGSGGGSNTGGSSGGSNTDTENTGGSNTGGSNTGGSNTGSESGSEDTGSSGSRPEPDWDEMQEQELQERDFEMEAYASRVRSVVRTYYARRAQTCFELATRNHQSVRGTVMIGFTIQASGQIVNTDVVRNTTGIDTIGTCLARHVDSWRLPPPPEGDAPLAMQMPFSR